MREALPYERWQATCDTLHAHTQLLGKLAAALAPPEPELQHAALRLTARGWETAPLPAPDRSGALVSLLDLRTHEAVLEHSDGRIRRIALTPDRSVSEVTRQVLDAIAAMVGPVNVNLTPQEVPWTVPLDQDEEHHTYDARQVTTYFSVATNAALALAELRAPYRGKSSPVNAWWGTVDLAVSLYSGRPAESTSNEFIKRNATDAEYIEIEWWTGDARYPRAAFYAYASPAPETLREARLSPPAARWDTDLGEYILEWDDVIAAADPHRILLEFGRSIIARACAVCGWDPVLSASAHGDLPPVR